MYNFALFLIIIANSLIKTNSIKCFTCEGIYDNLDNKTCSVISQNDSCYTFIDHSIYSGKWIVSMGGFNETSNQPDFYIKPKSGSAFYDQYWIMTGDVNNHFHMQTRFFCYKDFCNPLSIVSNFMKADLKYQSYDFRRNITDCLVCNASDYNSAKQCKQTNSCKCDTCSCSITANKHVNDLYNYGVWQSSCLSYPIQNGFIRLQFEIDTKLINIFTEIECLNSICSSFDFTNSFLNSIQLII